MVVQEMKKIIIIMTAALLALFLMACAPETPPEIPSPPEVSAPLTATEPAPAAEPATDEQLLQQYPDYLDEALQDLEEIE